MKRKIVGLFAIVSFVMLILPAMAWASPSITTASDTDLSPYEGKFTPIHIIVDGKDNNPSCTYQWQRKTSKGWYNLTNSYNSHKGVNTNCLKTFAVYTNYTDPDMYPYRCKVVMNNKTYYSKEYALRPKARTRLSDILTINFEAPRGNEKPFYGIESPAPSIYTIESVKWWDYPSQDTKREMSKSEHFVAGKRYMCNVEVSFDEKYMAAHNQARYWIGYTEAMEVYWSYAKVSFHAFFVAGEALSSPDPASAAKPVDISMPFPKEGDVKSAVSSLSNSAFTVSSVTYKKNGTAVAASKLNSELKFPNQVRVEMRLKYSSSLPVPEVSKVTWNGKPATSMVENSAGDTTYVWSKILVAPSNKKEINAVHIELDSLLPGEVLPTTVCTDPMPQVNCTTRWTSIIDGVTNTRAGGAIAKPGCEYEPTIQITPNPGEGYSWASDFKLYLNGVLVSSSKYSKSAAMISLNLASSGLYESEAPDFKGNSGSAKSLKIKASSKSRVIDLEPESTNGFVGITGVSGGLEVDEKDQIIVPANFAGIGTVSFVSFGRGYKKVSFSSTVKVLPAASKVKALKALGKSSVKVSWYKKASNTSYQIRYSYKKSMKSAKTVTLKKKSTVTKTLEKLKKGKRVYVQVRTYKKTSAGTLQSAWSAKKSVVVK